VVTVCLNNDEDVAVHDVVVSASLVKTFTTIKQRSLTIGNMVDEPAIRLKPYLHI